ERVGLRSEHLLRLIPSLTKLRVLDIEVEEVHNFDWVLPTAFTLERLSVVAAEPRVPYEALKTLNQMPALKNIYLRGCVQDGPDESSKWLHWPRPESDPTLLPWLESGVVQIRCKS